MSTTQLRVTMMLCDHAQVADGKLFISGGGWSVTGPEPVASAVAILVMVPWHQANSKIRFLLRLLHEDGNPVVPAGPAAAPVEVGGELEVGRPVGLAPGVTLDVPLAFNIPPLPLLPGQRFCWELSLDGVTAEDWRLPFATRQPAGPMGPPPAHPG